MSQLLKFAVSNLNTNLTYLDVSPQAGFVKASFDDIDRPFLDNHFFLMYDWSVKDKQVAATEYKLRSFDNLYNVRTMFVNKKPYVVYAFTLPVNLKRMKSCSFIDTKTKKNALDFWWNYDFNFSSDILNNKLYTPYVYDPIPVQDYRPDDESM